VKENIEYISIMKFQNYVRLFKNNASTDNMVYFGMSFVLISILMQIGICNSYNMSKRDLPDIYVQAQGLQARR